MAGFLFVGMSTGGALDACSNTSSMSRVDAKCASLSRRRQTALAGAMRSKDCRSATLVNDGRCRCIARSDALPDKSSCAPGRNPPHALDDFVAWIGRWNGHRSEVRFENQTFSINGADRASLFHDALHRWHYQPGMHFDPIAAARHDPDQKAGRLRHKWDRQAFDRFDGAVKRRLSRQHFRGNMVSEEAKGFILTGAGSAAVVRTTAGQLTRAELRTKFSATAPRTT
jgi:hypothetical protein